MPVPSIKKVEDWNVDIDATAELVNGFGMVPTRFGGNKPSYSLLMSRIAHGDISTYSALATYSEITHWVERNGVVYRPVPSYLPIGPEAFDPAKWIVAQDNVGPKNAGVVLAFDSVSSLTDSTQPGTFAASDGRIINVQDLIPNDSTMVFLQTHEYHPGTAVGGGYYVGKSLVKHRADLGKPEWEPDGRSDHYIAGTNTRVAILASSSLNVFQFGAIGKKEVDSTDAIQAALTYISNSSSYGQSIKLEFNPYRYPAHFNVTRPLTFHGDALIIDGNNCVVSKSTDDIPAEPIPLRSVVGGMVSPNVNAIFVTSDRVRWLQFRNFNLEGLGAARPKGIWFFGNENRFENINIRSCSDGVESPSSWLTSLENIIARNATGHGFWWNRLRENGAEGQSGTSLTFKNCASFANLGRGFYMHDVDYITMIACACDLSAEEAYVFQGCTGLNANIAFESKKLESTTPAIRLSSGSNGHITLDCYEETAFANEAIKVTDSQVRIEGRLRVANLKYFDATRSVIDARNLVISPTDVEDDAFSLEKYACSENSHIYCVAPGAGTLKQRLIYQYTDTARYVTHDGVARMSTGTSGGRDIFYGARSLRVVYDNVTFDSTQDNQIKIPLQEISAVLPGFDKDSWQTIPLGFTITERQNLRTGYYAIIDGTTLRAWGSSPGQLTVGTASKVAVSSMAIVAGELVITMDPAGGSRQRVSCDVYQAK